MEKLTATVKRQRTQWSTQFLAAAELIRRGHTVSFTQGNNTPVADLMVGAPSSKLYWVDVKGLSAKNSWFLHPKEIRADLFYILVLLAPLANAPESRRPDRFFILTQAEANQTEAAYLQNHAGDNGRARGFSFKDAEQFEGQWGKLPR